ncbi:MAG: AMP-binding protein, partial [Acidobacteriota bacterium]|nr:AMP-binding protein [Acidobacteriota bacterium]
MLNLATILEETALRHPDKSAFVLGPHRLSFAELDQASSSLAAALSHSGLALGDKVALGCPNLPAFPIVYYGILKGGGVVVPLNVLLKRREIAYHLADSDAKIFFCFEGTAELPMA